MTGKARFKLWRTDGYETTLTDGTPYRRVGGWRWVCDGHEYETNRDGEGLFKISSNGERRQLRGTCQYSLPAGREECLHTLRREDFAPDAIEGV